MAKYGPSMLANKHEKVNSYYEDNIGKKVEKDFTRKPICLI